MGQKDLCIIEIQGCFLRPQSSPNLGSFTEPLDPVAAEKLKGTSQEDVAVSLKR